MSDIEASSATLIEQAIRERSRVALGHILGVKDALRISPEDSRRIRGIVIHELNELTDLACAFVRAMDDRGVNEHAIELLREVHSHVVPVEALDGG